MSDLIYRQDAIELVKNSYYNLAESMEDTWAMVADVENLPPAEPEIIRCKDVPDINVGDLIYRSDALACFSDWVDSKGDVHSADEMAEYQRIEALPSVEPEVIDLISRQAAKDNAHRQLWYRMNRQEMRDRIDEWLDALPSAESEIIRCKDCK